MFEKNGIIYASEPIPGIKVTGACFVGNACLLITFSTGETRLFDATKLTSFPVFAPLGNPDVLARFSIDHGMLTWLDSTIDISPEGLYARTYPHSMTA